MGKKCRKLEYHFTSRGESGDDGSKKTKVEKTEIYNLNASLDDGTGLTRMKQRRTRNI
jgi:hypothetical protein